MDDKLAKVTEEVFEIATQRKPIDGVDDSVLLAISETIERYSGFENYGIDFQNDNTKNSTVANHFEFTVENKNGVIEYSHNLDINKEIGLIRITTDDHDINKPSGSSVKEIVKKLSINGNEIVTKYSFSPYNEPLSIINTTIREFVKNPSDFTFELVENRKINIKLFERFEHKKRSLF